MQPDTITASTAGNAIRSMTHDSMQIGTKLKRQYWCGREGGRRAYLEEAIQCSQRWMCDEIELETMQHIELVAQHTLAVLAH